LPPEIGRTAPYDLIEKRTASENLVEQETDEVGGAIVDVHPDRPARGKQSGERLEARGKHVEVRPNSIAVPSIVVGHRAQDAAVSRAVEPRLIVISRLGSKRWIHVHDAYLAAQTTRKKCTAHVERVAVDESTRRGRPRSRPAALVSYERGTRGHGLESVRLPKAARPA
jgi:hypothetical protein